MQIGGRVFCNRRFFFGPYWKQGTVDFSIVARLCGSV